MMESAEAHRLSFRFDPIDLFYIDGDGKRVDDRLIRVALLQDGEHTGRGSSVFASGREYPEDTEWSIKEK